MAEYCDIVMDICSKYNNRFINYNSIPEPKDLITLNNWQMAIDAIKGCNYLGSVAGQPYSVCLNSFGRTFYNDGKTFVKLVEQENESKLIEADRQNKIDNKLELDLIQAKRQVKWFGPLLTISFVGCVGTIVGIWNIARMKSEENRLKTIDTSISRLFQKQKVDSIRVWQIEFQKKPSP